MTGQKPSETAISIIKANASDILPEYSVVVNAVMMYCKRMHIDCIFEEDGPYLIKFTVAGGIDPSDPVIGCLYDFFEKKRFSRAILYIWERLRDADEEEFISNYPTKIDVYFRTLSYYYGKKGNIEYIQPSRLTRVITYFLRQHAVSSIYNPFAGLCSYPISMGKACSFFAQEINLVTLALAKIRLHAYGLDPNNIVLEDSIIHWNHKGAEAIVASVPFGLQISSEYRHKYNIASRTIEDLFFERSLDDKSSLPPKIVATVVPDSFCYRSSSEPFRKKMCELGCLDTVIKLPEGILPYTSVAATIIILSFETKKKEVRFVNATEFLKDDKESARLLDSKQVISVIENNDGQYVKTVSYSELYNQGCVLNGDNYIYDSSACKEGHRIMRLGDLIARVRLSRIDHPEDVYLVPEKAFTNKVLDIIYPKSEALKLTEVKDGYKVTGPCILFLTKDRQLFTYLHLTNSAIAVDKRVYAFKVINSEVTPQYMASLLIHDEVFRRQAIQSSVHVFASMAQYMLNRNMVIADSAWQGAYLKEHAAKESAEISIQRAAEDARYQLNKAGSDIAHMLGSVFKKQKEIIREFRYIEPGTDKYQGNVTSLIDTAQYVNRVITAVGKDLTKAKINLKSTLISSEVEDYVRAWGNFNGSSDFSLIIQDLTNHDVSVKMDTLLFRILMDTLIDNAWRHGFEQGSYNAENGNMIAVRLSPVLLEEKQFLLLSVMNNGRPLDEHYKVRDYIERGNFKGDSGRTGLGGNHVYTITKRHDGFFALNSEQDWCFVADILLPVDNPGNTLFNTEYDGEYV